MFTALTLDSRTFPDPYDFIIGNLLIVEFYGYRDKVDFANMESCVDDANHEVIQKVLVDQGQAPMGTDTYFWSSGNVSLSLFPDEQLTWAKWSLVPAAIRRFVAENGLKGTQFIILWHELGPIGYGQIVVSSEAHSLTANAAGNALPDPYDMTIQSIGLTIEFYGYRGSMSPTAISDCISAAIHDVLQHVAESEVTMRMEAPSYSYSADEVNLFLSPTKNLKWNMWAFVPTWIQEFVAANGFRGTQFILLWEGFGVVGSGHLINESTNTASTTGLGIS